MIPEDPNPPTAFTTLRNEQHESASALRSYLAEHPEAASAVYLGDASSTPVERQAQNYQRWAIDALHEDSGQRRANMQTSADWADEQVARQVDGMGVNRFEVGVLTAGGPNGKTMRLQAMNSNDVIAASAELRRLNMAGAEIHIRPKEDGGYSLSLVDDVNLGTLGRMKREGFTPAVVVRTSPDNYQAWMRHGERLNAETSYVVGKALAEKFGADIGGAPAGHMGRLAGTTNRKEQYRTPEGKSPWVVVSEASGAIYEAAPEFLPAMKQKLALELRERYERSHQNRLGAERTFGTLKTIEDFRQDSRYAGDGNRIDFAYAMYARSKGIDRAEVAAAIATRDLKHKAKNYVEYTIRRAEERIRPVRQIGIGI